MKISVILSAYCGGKYLAQQLDSLVHQTKLPDELILIDDCSPDDGITVSIIDDYCSRYGFIKKVTNQVNLGWSKSFMNGTLLVSDDTDIIFFCDQDDIWVKTKIEELSGLFEDNSINAVISDCKNIVSENEVIESQKKCGALLSNTFRFNRHFIYAKGVGAAMALRKSFVDRYRFLWNETIGHDRFFQIMAVMFDRLYYYDVVTTYHRIHDNNATGRREFDIHFRIRGVEGNLDLLDDIKQNVLLDHLEKKKKRIIAGYSRFAKKRLLMLKERSLIRWFTMILFCLGYYPTSKTWFGDLKWIRSKDR